MQIRPWVRTTSVLGRSLRRSTYPRAAVSQSSASTAPTTPTASSRSLTSELRLPPWQHNRLFSSSPATARDTMASQEENPLANLEKYLTPALLSGVRDFWFEHLEHEDDFVLPKPSLSMRWFMGGKELDDLCVQHYAPTLEAILHSGATTGDEILDIAKPAGPLDWLSLVLLLDQIPRNCYRGEESRIVFNFFDPIAQQVASEAIAQGIPDQNPEIRWHFAYRNWFYLPLMHSESLADHERALEAYGSMRGDVLHLAEGEGTTEESELEKRAREVVQRDLETAKKVAETNLSFEVRHYNIIKEFGRYPHRNKVLGREPTEAEVAYLENGGETFS